MPRAQFLAMTKEQRMFTSLGITDEWLVARMNGTLKEKLPEPTECKRLITERCPSCGSGICSDHMAQHIDWCGNP